MKNRTIRILILAAVALLLFFLAKDRVLGAFSDPPATVQSQPLVLQNSPAQATPATPATPTANPQLAAATGLVWNDLDHDGFHRLEEPGIPGVTVNLMSAANVLIGTAITGADGAYRFENLLPGDYFVTILQPTGYVFSPKDQGQNDLVDSDSDPIVAQTPPAALVAGENGLVWTTGIYAPAAALVADPGTVRPPPSVLDICSAGVYSLGGTSTLNVKLLAPEYCLHVFLWNHAFAIGRIPPDAGSVLSAVTFEEIFHQNLFVYSYDVPGQTDSIQVCYAVPMGMTAQIYFFDFYGPRFGTRTGQPSWEPLPTTIQNNFACAVAQKSGAYALIGK